MKRLMTTGLLALTALALIAVAGASAASASQFRGLSYPAEVTASQGTVQKLSLGGGAMNLKCGTVGGTGTIAAASTNLELAPSYEQCSLGGLAATAKTNGCRIVYAGTNETEPFVGTFGVSCGAGKALEFTQGSCTVSIPSQAGQSSVALANAGTGLSRTVTATYAIGGLKYSGSSGCAASMVGSHENGSLSGSSVLAAPRTGVFVGNSQIEPMPPKEGHVFAIGSSPSIIESSASPAAQFYLGGPEGFRCSTLTEEGRATGAQTGELSTAPRISGCLFLGLNFAASTTGCRFVYSVNPSYPFEALVGNSRIACEAGHEITFTEGACTWTVPAQEFADSVTYSNVTGGPAGEIEATHRMTSVKSTAGPGCYAGYPGFHSNGEILYKSLAKAYKSEAGVKGVQVGLQVK
jgi:hypothetical protein